jgi:prepilin-type N-terminal cleavage/methylation domain-containing protein
MKKKNNKNKIGFTLIELTVSIAIIALLISAVVISFYNIRENARNANRAQDIIEIQVALERYYQNHQTYPESISFGEKIEKEGKIYLAVVPSNPEPRDDGICPDSDYIYTFLGEENYYSLSFCLSKNVGDMKKGMNCAYPNGILNQDCD